MKHVALFIGLLSLTACSSPNIYESVTVRIGELSCTEKLSFEKKDEAGIDITKYGEQATTKLALDIGALASLRSGTVQTPQQRCGKILASAEEYMKSKAEIKQTESLSKQSDLERTRAKNALEIERLKNSSLEFTTEW